MAEIFANPPSLPLAPWRRWLESGSDPFGARSLVSPELPAGIRSDLNAVQAIEDFRRADFVHAKFCGAEVSRTFRSSGTTQADRSYSLFSPAGLAAYQETSIYLLRHVLAQVFGAADSQETAPAGGLSLIPPVDVWPDSSLAQMLAWAAHCMPVSYVSAADVAARVANAGGQPLWLFGTAFHFLDLIDQGLATSLPQGSVIIETGGTKGKTRAVTRAELYQELAQAFAVPETAIVSEYGMGELATQAYDFVPRGTAAGWRRFRFPAWVKVSVLCGPGDIRARGRGALVVEDPGRTDFPWPLRTEDLVELEDDGSFCLLGRMDRAPLKGCSLLAESFNPPLPSVPAAEHLVRTGATNRALGAWTSDARQRCRALASCLAKFLRASATRDLLAGEFGSQAAAAGALIDLEAGIPGTEAAWLSATQLAAGSTPPKLNRWLFILPDNHSLVGIYPLALSYILGYTVTVRMPRRFAGRDNALRTFIDHLQDLPAAKLSSVSPDWRLGAGAAHPGELALKDRFDAILAYGNDTSITTLGQASGLAICGFGSHLSLSAVTNRELTTDPGVAAAVCRDVLGFAQSGCLSTRLLLVTATPAEMLVPSANIAAQLQTAARQMWSAEIPWRARVGLDSEARRLRRAGFTPYVPEGTATPLVAIRDLHLESHLSGTVPSPDVVDAARAALQDGLALAPFTITVLRLDERVAETFVKSALTPLVVNGPLGLMTKSAGFRAKSLLNFSHPRLSFRQVGGANAPIWDGLHQGLPLFLPMQVAPTPTH